MDPALAHGRLGQSTWDLPEVMASSSELARPGYDAGDASEFRDSESTMLEKVKALADLLRQSSAVCVYTGAGISTASGIGDYASKASGSIAPHRNEAKTKANGSRLEARPTQGHHVLAALEAKGLLHHWVQQNHDRLAQKAGFPQEKLNEIHGAWGDNKNSVKMMDDALRPDLLEWLRIWEAKADMCIAIGTSLCGMNADQVAAGCALRNCNGLPGQQGLVPFQRFRPSSH
jgi:hypothetical protein